ncbi:cytochrome P450 [Streptomyces sp. NPDC091267]|uniref:cytochrome P450 n=1 Tax=unclassified Streptomyces TaxID=2593676 RepID=UPI00341D04F5
MTTTLDWNPLDPASIRDPHSVYQELRENFPVYWHAGMSSWVLTRYDDCQTVLRDYATFARDRRRVGVEIPDEKLNIQTQDPPEQALLRGITAKALNAQRLRKHCVDARHLMEERLSALAGSGPFDMMGDVAGPAAMQVINRVFGVDEYTQTSYAPIYEGLTQAMDSGLDPKRLAPGRAAGKSLAAEVTSWYERGLGASGMFGALYGNADVAQMPRPYVINTMAATYNAGFSTLYASTGAVTMELLGAGLGDLRELPLPNDSALVLATEELLRYVSPAQATARVATTPTEIQGVRIEAGDTLVTMLAAANRDPRQFKDPDRIVLDRSPNPHLALAWGPHICLGARLAQAWIMELITFLVEHGPRLRLIGGEKYMSSATLRNLVSLPVEYDAAS